MPYKDPAVHRAYQREHFKKKRRALKERIVLYLGGECLRCGYKKCLAALHAHHHGIKKFGINESYTKSWEEIEQELKNCVLMCANCHAEEHA
jgi:hypothetical protein